jgi:antitoxin component of MazEF toxin-antitoxin module
MVSLCQGLLTMRHRIQIIEIGDAAGFILPDDMIAALGVKVGDDLILSADSEGWILRAGKPDPARPDCAND